MHLVDLPIDILKEIFDYFHTFKFTEGNRWFHGGRYRQYIEDSNRETLKNVRLSCRSLYNVATPRLFRLLCVGLTNDSIDTFLQLARNPLISSNAHGVVFDLATYSTSFAGNIEAFKNHRLAEVEKKFHGLECELGRCSSCNGIEPNEDKEWELNSQLRTLSCAWAQVVRDQGHDDSDPRWEDIVWEADAKEWWPELYDQCSRLLVNSHREYVRLHREQVSNASDIDKLKAIASAIANLSCSGTIGFDCRHSRYSTMRNASVQLTEMFSNPEAILWEEMVRPFKWQELNQDIDDEVAKLIPLLSILPIAIDEAGGTMREVFMECFPHYTGFPSLFPTEGSIMNVTPQRLRQAYRELKVFSFGMGSRNTRHEPLSAQNRYYMNNYLGAAISSNTLRELSLDFWSYGIVTWNGTIQFPEPEFEVQNILSQLTTRHLVRVQLTSFRGRFEEVSPIFRALSKKATSLAISQAELLDGHWVDMLGPVRKRMKKRCRKGLCHTAFPSLRDRGVSYHFRYGGKWPNLINIIRLLSPDKNKKRRRA